MLMSRVIADIQPQLLQIVIENWASPLKFIRASRGGYLPEINYKYKMAKLYLYNKVKFLAIIYSFYFSLKKLFKKTPFI